MSHRSTIVNRSQMKWKHGPEHKGYVRTPVMPEQPPRKHKGPRGKLGKRK